MTFVNPELLLFLLLIPPLLLVTWRRSRPATLPFPGAEEIAALRPSLAARLHAAMPWLRALALALAIVAMARPQWSVEITRTRREGIAIAMVIDVSSSMSAMDLTLGERPANRLEVVRAAFRDFVRGGSDGLGGREGDQIAMVTFARFADIVVPPTLDHEALLAALEQVHLVTFPLEDGTAIGDAILRTVEMVRRLPSKSRVAILLTDGSNNVGKAEPLVAAQIAAAFGIKIYTIGAGSNGTAAVPFLAADGTVEYRTSPVSIDEDTLLQVAQLTNARYFRATDGAALRAIYAEIDQLEKTRNLLDYEQRRVELFPLFIGLALLLLVSEVVLTRTRLQTIP
jgi:Ca-activated chloride channel family protein